MGARRRAQCFTDAAASGQQQTFASTVRIIVGTLLATDGTTELAALIGWQHPS